MGLVGFYLRQKEGEGWRSRYILLEFHREDGAVLPFNVNLKQRQQDAG